MTVEKIVYVLPPADDIRLMALPPAPTIIGGSVSDDVLCRSVVAEGNGRFTNLQTWSAAHAGDKP